MLSGPTFAHEVAAGLPTAVTLACSGGRAQWDRLCPQIARAALRPYYSDDLIGAEIGGAVKNVLAIACGVVEGLGLGQNARAALIARGYAEMLRFGLALGARAETLSGLCGLGDLVLTCTSHRQPQLLAGQSAGRRTERRRSAVRPQQRGRRRAYRAGTQPAGDRARHRHADRGRRVQLAGGSCPRPRRGFRSARPSAQGRTGRARDRDRRLTVNSAAPPFDAPKTTAQEDIAALAKGGRTNFMGFLLRLMARVPFLFIAGRLYGAESLGRFASAMVAIELAGQFCTLGQKRGLAQRLSLEDRHPANIVADAMLLSTMIAGVAMTLLFLFPAPMFPSGIHSYYDLFLPLVLIPTTQTDIALSALAYRFDVRTTVRSRAVVEPWTLSIMAGVMYFIVPDGGLAIAYIASMFTSAAVALVPLARSYGWAKAGGRIRCAWPGWPGPACR